MTLFSMYDVFFPLKIEMSQLFIQVIDKLEIFLTCSR